MDWHSPERTASLPVESRVHNGTGKSRVLFGGEDPPEYVWNFIASIQAAGYSFVRVNAKEAKKHRTNTRATSDVLALDGIAQVMLLRRAYDLAHRDEVYGAMKLSERARRKLKRQETALKNRMHRIADVLFPGLLKESLSGLLPFGVSCLKLMEVGCSVVRVKRMRTDTLANRLKEGRTQTPAEVAIKLKELARSALPPGPDIVPYMEQSLATKARYMKALRESLRLEENEMARCLAQTPGFLLTTIPGLGVVLTGGIVAEYGDINNWRLPDQMASYAGIVCRQYQTGGPDAGPVRGSLPPSALNPGAPDAMPAEQFIAYLQIVAQMLVTKWKGYDLSGIPEERNRLDRWLRSTAELAEQFMKHK